MTRTGAIEARTRVVTQTLTRSSTTLTAVVTLGGSDSAPAPPSPVTENNHDTSLATDTITAPAPSTTLTSNQLGALLGSVFGLAFLALLVYCVLSFRRRQRCRPGRGHHHGIRQHGAKSSAGVVDYNSWYGRYYYYGRGGDAGAPSTARVNTAAWTTVPPPVRFPPAPRHAAYVQTREAQIGGVRKFP